MCERKSSIRNHTEGDPKAQRKLINVRPPRSDGPPLPSYTLQDEDLDTIRLLHAGNGVRNNPFHSARGCRMLIMPGDTHLHNGELLRKD